LSQVTEKEPSIKGGRSIKILAIVGSPHKGNSLEKTQGIESRLRQFGDVEFEYVHLS